MKVYELSREEFEEYMEKYRPEFDDMLIDAELPADIYKVLCKLKDILEGEVCE